MYTPVEQLINGYIIGYDNMIGKWVTTEKDSKYVTLMRHTTYEKARKYVDDKTKVK